ncbi:MAG: undecaprenyl-diphosphate phosphatase [Planctomycetes bacterium]|nr:undecaprenyl-diphosphate phosphatase [Planctomycetota bacterium]
MTIFDAFILGIVEGFTEYLPVSSTGHLILAASLLGLGTGDGTKDMATIKAALDQFEIIIQGGAILAVAGIYWKRLKTMAHGCVGFVHPERATKESHAGFQLLLKLILAFIPAAVVGLTLQKTIKAHFFYPVPVIIALLIGGVLMVSLKGWHKKKLEKHKRGDTISHLSFRGAAFIGLMQTLALMPGTSRSLVTLLGGMLMGLSPVAAAEFAFLLGLPTLSAAAVYETFSLFKDGTVGVTQFIGALGGPLPVLVGLATATLSAAISVKWLVKWLTHHTLAVFGWWRIAVAGCFTVAILAGWIAR